jgi:uncharacterized RDD family membrane protein YckC
MSAIPRPSPSANPYAPPRARVRDVAAPKAALVLAERSARLGAAIVDGLIFTAMVYLPMIVAMAFVGAAASATTPETTDTTAGLILFGGVALMFVGFIVWTWMTLKQMKATGQSLAKKYFNIKVVRGDGSPASLGNLFWKRNMLTWLISIIPFYGIVEVLFIFAEDRRCLHDRMADTIVVEA